MAIRFNFILTFFFILVFLLIECHSGIVLKNFKSRRTLMAELEKETTEAKARVDDNASVIDLPRGDTKLKHVNRNFIKPSDRISPRMKDETRTSKKPKFKGSLKFNNVTEVINRTEEVGKLPKHSNDVHITKPRNQTKIEVRNQTKPFKLPINETSPKVLSKTTNSDEHHIINQKVVNKIDHGNSPKHENSLEPRNTVEIAGQNITKTINRTLTEDGNSTVSTFVHLSATNAMPNISEVAQLKNSFVTSNNTEVVQLNFAMGGEQNVTRNDDSVTANLNITEVRHLNLTETVMSNSTEVLHLNITEAEKTNITAVKNLDFTMTIKPNVSEVFHLNSTKVVHPNVTDVMHLNVKIELNPDVAKAVKSNNTKVMHLNPTQVKSTVRELTSSNVTKGINTNSKPEVDITKVNSKRESTTSFINSSMTGKDSHDSKNSSSHVNGHLKNMHNVSSHLNTTTLNEDVDKTKSNLENLNILSILNRSDLKEIPSIVNNSVNVPSMNVQNFNSSSSNWSNSLSNSIHMTNEENSLALKDSTLIAQESVTLNKTSVVPVKGMKQSSNTDKDLNNGRNEPFLIQMGQKNVSDSKNVSLNVGNTEELKVQSNGTDEPLEALSVPHKIRENTNFLKTQLTSIPENEVTNLNVNVSKHSSDSEILNISSNPVFNFSLPISLPFETIGNKTIFESLVNLTKIILTDEINPEPQTIDEKPGDEILNNVSGSFISETDIENTHNKSSKKEIFNLGNEKVDKNKNVSHFSELTKMDNKSKIVESEMVTMVLLPEESNSTQSVSGLDFLVNSEVAKNAVLAMEVFNLSDTSLTDHVIEDSDIHSFIDLMMPAVSNSHHEEVPKTKNANETELSNSSDQKTTEVESFPLNETSDNIKRNESVVEFVDVPSNDSEFLAVELGNINSTEIIEVLKCPRPGLCLFWFSSRDTCTHHNQCLPSQLCCRVRCSKHCIDAEPQ